MKVSNTIKTGRIQKVIERKCVNCKDWVTEYYYPSYSANKQLDVVPLCRSCHRIRHNTESL